MYNFGQTKRHVNEKCKKVITQMSTYCIVRKQYESDSFDDE